MNIEKGADWKGMAACIVCHVFWGFSFMASRVALDTAPVFVLLSHRFLIALAVMSLFARGRVHFLSRSKKSLILLICLGLAEPVVYFFGEQYGLLHSSTIFSGVMIAMIPIVCTMLAIPLLGEKPSVGQVLFSLLSVAGVIGVGLTQKSSGTLDWIGVAALLLAVLSAVAYTLISRRLSGEVSAFERTYMMMLQGALVFTALSLIRCRSDWASYLKPFESRDYLISVLFLAVGCSVLSYFLSGYAIGRLSVARQTVFANLTTAVSIFAGTVFLHEAFTWLTLLCCLLILGGIFGVQAAGAKRENGKSEV